MLFGPSPQALSEIECWRLLGAGGIGRLAVTIGALPRIVPVRYALDSGQILLCLGDQAELTDAVNNTVVAFAADSLTDDNRHGWFVEINGVAELAPSMERTRGCSHESPPLIASVEPTLITGSTYRLCDAGLVGGSTDL